EDGIFLEGGERAVVLVPGAVVERGGFAGAGPVVDVKPADVRRSFASLDDILKSPERPTDVVEDAVDDYLKALAVGVGEEVEEDAVAAAPAPAGGVIGLAGKLGGVFGRAEVVIDVAVV